MQCRDKAYYFQLEWSFLKKQQSQTEKKIENKCIWVNIIRNTRPSILHNTYAIK